LMLAAYTKNPSAPNDPDGLVQIWNMHLHSRPEFIFHAQSDVLTARFSPFHPNLVIGGAYSGQVMIWDTRAKSQPVLKTPLTGSGHTHPVYSIAMVGTQNANNILSCSTDGVVCMLAQPQEFLELTTPPVKALKTDDLSPTCMAFPLSDPTYFLVGTEEGSIYPCHRYDRAGAKAGVEPRIFYSGHTAPVMSVDFHPARGPIDLGDLVLSSSLDWSVKIWKARPPASTTASAANAPTVAAAPILDLSREDVVYDAKWNPVKPGMFGLVDGAGQLELWDITSDIEVPWVKASPSSRVGATLLTKSLNKLAWEEHEGKKVAVGGLDGMVTVFDVAFDAPRNEEWSIIKKLTGRSEGNVTNSVSTGALGGSTTLGGQLTSNGLGR
jgi:dynein intermediate chain, cytosolic